MERQQAIDYIKHNVSCTNYLTQSKGNSMYNCPFCGSGTGKNKTGALQHFTDTNRIKCHACGKSGSVIDIYMQMYGVDLNYAIEQLASTAGISIDPYEPQNRSYKAHGSTDGKTNDQNSAEGSQSDTEPQNDYIEYYQQCAARIEDPAAVTYLASRGISIATGKAYMIGFDPLADPAQSGHPAPRLIIPCSKSHYIGRAIDDNIAPAYKKMNPKGNTPAIFNSKVLSQGDVKYIFVAEGAIDALSIIEAGGTAIALNSTANANKLIDLLTKIRPKATLIICCDNDDAGRKAADTITDGCKKLGIRYITANICGEYKDPNDALTGNRESFLEAVEYAKVQAMDKPDNVLYYIDHMMLNEINLNQSEKKTGFEKLDKIAGGLYAGLYCIAATSSLGKTTFALQIADQLATAGHDVIFFSLEQSRLELVTKSLSRQTYIESKYDDKFDALSSINIRRGKYNVHQRDLLQTAMLNYKANVGTRMNIVEGNFNCDISFISNYLEQYMRRTDTKPVIFIDYLQILQPTNDARKLDTRSTVDAAITQLKRISRDHNITIFVISSVNRNNYLTPIDFESLKESGNIEYTCDVVWGLQFQCLNDDLFKELNKVTEKRAAIKKARMSIPRQIQLCCLKNRYGIGTYECNFTYYPQFDLFTESAATLAEQADTKPPIIIH